MVEVGILVDDDRGIAAEYRGHVPGWMFRLNRRRFLKTLLAKEQIFLSDFFHDRFDAQARANLQQALSALGQGQLYE